MELLHIFISHCAAAVPITIIRYFTRIEKSAPKSTLPLPSIKSIALPVRIGA